MPKVKRQKGRALQAPTVPTSLADMLKAAAIKRITVIDDVFDPPAADEINDHDLREFAQRADTDEARAEAQAIGIDVSGGPDQGPDVRAQLWQKCLARKRTALGELAATHLYSARLHRKRDLDRLGEALGQAALSVKTYGALDQSVSTRRAQLIFLDYHLDPPNTVAPDAVGQRAVAKIDEVKFSKGTIPYIILISDKDITEQDRRDICRAVNKKGGFFGFIHKRDLKNANVLCLKLAELGVGLDVNGRNAIRDFTTKAAGAIKDAADNLTSLLHSLELQDYVHLQNLKLHGDGEALGEYLQWMLEAKLGHLFSDNGEVRPARKALDSVAYQLLPTPKPPSRVLLRTFHSAQTEAGIPPATWTSVISARSFMLGDVFLHRNKKQVRVIINPACDLVASPFPQGRQPSEDQRVYLISGKVLSMAGPAPDKEVTSEGLLIEGEPSRIVWNLRGVTSTDHGRLRTSLRKGRFRFIFRLRPLFALAIQRRFIDHIGRIGLPTTPPYCEPASVQIFVGKKGAELLPVGLPIAHAADLVHKKALECRLTVDGVSMIIERLKETLKTIGNRPDNDLTDVEKAVKAVKDGIEGSAVSSEVWLPFVTQFRTFPKPGNAADKIPDLYLGIVGPGTQCKGPFTLVVVRDEE